MNGYSSALLGADTIRRNRPVGPAQIHPAPDERKRAEEDRQREFYYRVEWLLLFGSGNVGNRVCHGRGRTNLSRWRKRRQLSAPSSEAAASSRSVLSASRATATTRSSSLSRSRMRTPW